MVSPAALVGVYYPPSMGELAAWFSTDAECRATWSGCGGRTDLCVGTAVVLVAGDSLTAGRCVTRAARVPRPPRA